VCRDINELKSGFQPRGELGNYNVVPLLHATPVFDGFCV
jgi:hypothetical protein